MIDFLLLVLNVIDFYRQNKSRNSMHETNKHTDKFHLIMMPKKSTTRFFKKEEQEAEESKRIGLN
jgi:hypothetical protein